VKKNVNVTGLFVNELFNASAFSSIPVAWEIQSGAAAGEAGTPVCSGTGTATATPTGRSFDELTEMTILIQLPAGEVCTLTGPTENDEKLQNPLYGKCTSVCVYNMGVQPQSVGGSMAKGQEISLVGYLSDVEGTPAHHYGQKDVLDDSFFSSVSYDFFYQPTAGPNGVCAMDNPNLSLTSVGCDMFSVGLLGTVEK